MIQIEGYAVAHGKNGEGGGGTTIINGGGNTSIPSNLNVTSITAGTGTINTLNGVSLNYNDAKIMYLSCGDGKINKLRGDEINYALGQIDKLYSSDIKTNTIKTEDLDATKAWIEELNSKYITTEYLTVTKQAHFFELIIDKVRAVGGTMIMSQAQSVIDYAKAMKKVGSTYVEVPITSNEAQYYDVFFLGKDENNNRTITNDWVPGDQAYCQSFNNVSTGVNYDVSNKYYWRLVTEILPDRYMNINTGAELPLNQSAQASVNSVFINTPTIVYNTGKPNDTEDKEGNWGWHTEAQEIAGLPQNPTWNEISGGIEEVTKGTMTTTNTILGIQLTPIEGSGLDQITPKQFIVSCNNPDTTVVEKARINIGVYYVDGSSQWFPAPDSPQETYTCNLTTQVPIESVVITNADEVEWKLVHGIRLSNKYSDGECAEMLSGSASIPSAGDNLTQLGYRYPYGENDTNEPSRGNAIIIAAYKTPDGGTRIDGDRNKEAIKPPSYAQYEAIGSDPAHYFDLAHYRKTYMDSNGSKFIGEFYAQSGNDINKLETSYTHVAYMNTPDNSDDSFTTNPQGGKYKHIGTLTDNNAEASQNWQAYSWAEMPETKTYRLIDQGSQVYSQMTLNNNNNATKTFVINLSFKVMCVEGTSTRYMTMGEMRDWDNPLERSTNYNGFYPYVRYSRSEGSSPNYKYYKLALNSDAADNADAVFTLSWSSTNTNNISWNNEIIVKLIEANIRNANVQTDCYINDNDEAALKLTHDTVSMPVSMLSSTTMQLLDNSFSVLSANSNSISQLQQNAESITQTVNDLNGTVNTLSTSITGISATATHAEETAEGAATQVANLTLQYDQISLSVTNMENGLSTTGIDITNGTINLQAGRVTFSDSQGNTGKISIDPSTGTLNATDANISGRITATSGSITGDMEVKNPNGSGTKILISPRMNNTWGANISGYVSNNTKLFSLDFSFRDSDWTYHPNFLLGQFGDGNSYIKLTDESYTQQLITPGPDPYLPGDQYTFTNTVYNDNNIYTVGIKISGPIDGDTISFGMRKINNEQKIILQATDFNNKSMFPALSAVSGVYALDNLGVTHGLVHQMTLSNLKAIIDGGTTYWDMFNNLCVLVVRQ